MTYHFEFLDDERFQQLCQSILTCTHPNLQCLPVGQPDGGRDAFLLRRSHPNKAPTGEFIVFQVKFVKDPASREARDSIEQVIKSEKSKVDRLVERGARAYYLLTNARGTSHLESGSIDKVNAELSSGLGIEAYCWWRDDLERRVDANPNLKWSYPEIIRGVDLLQVLLSADHGQEEKRRMDVVRAYMAHQFTYDSQLKFKQIDLQKSIVDLFVDVPARVIPPRDEVNRTKWSAHLDRSVLEIVAADLPHADLDDDLGERTLSRAPGAVQLLARAEVARAFPRVVMEGAPGQGKSTITQFLCQVHRMILLNRSDFGRVALEHRPNEVRIPFRVDLRDYARWISGVDPFSDDPQARLQPGNNPILESFLAAQVHRYTGRAFSVDDLTHLASNAQLLIVLDGFDEVADIPSRNRLVNEISDAATRIETSAISVQIIVTSRPAAFANSPGFSREEWQHINILALSRAAIGTYATKWLDGRGADQRERREITAVLTDKLNEPHVRDLARNPMQLAILLALISVQGASLPDKRTALYDKYIDIFFNRESEKSTVVRDHRDLLIQIHRYLAWMLQVEAENSRAGNIAEARLREVLRAYLEQGGHETKLVDSLFTGMMERVVALVSRIQGTFEFEVQPLREYFAARYLYDTAPYSPPGFQRRGTLPERFDAIARNSYWLNVTRFYAGCYSSGELSSLVHGLEELESTEQFRYTSHVRRLIAILLSDYVFSHQPKLIDKLAERLTAGSLFRILLAGGDNEPHASALVLPQRAGRSKLLECCKSLLISAASREDVIYAAANTIVANGGPEQARDIWYQIREAVADDIKWIKIGSHLEVISMLPIETCAALAKELGSHVVVQLAQHGRIDVIESDENISSLVVKQVLDGNIWYYGPRSRQRSVSSNFSVVLSYFTQLFAAFWFDDINEAPDEVPLQEFLMRVGPNFGEHLRRGLGDVASQDGVPFSKDYLEFLGSFLDTRISSLKGSLDPWSNLIELTRAEWGDRSTLYRVAVAAAALVKEKQVNKCQLDDTDVPICHRAAYAHVAGSDVDWWREQMVRARDADPLTRSFILLCLQAYIPIETILLLEVDVSKTFDLLPQREWQELARATFPGRRRLRKRQSGPNIKAKGTRQKRFSQLLPRSISPRLASMIVDQFGSDAAHFVYDKYLNSYSGNDVRILQSCLDAQVEKAKENPAEWPAALAIFARLYRAGFGRHHLMLRRGYGNTLLPVNEARRVCSHPEEYPLELLALAEAALMAKTGADAIPVGKIAAHDEWFVD